MKKFVDDDIKRDEWSVPSMKVDVQLIADYFKTTLGATIAEVTMASNHSKMSHGPILKRDCAIYKVLKAKPDLKNGSKDSKSTTNCTDVPRRMETEKTKMRKKTLTVVEKEKAC